MAVEAAIGNGAVESVKVSSENGGVVEQVAARIYEILASYGLNLVAAILILIIGLWLAKVISNFVKNQMSRSKVDATLVSFIYHLVHAGIVIFVVIAACAKLGIQTTSFVAVLAAAGLAVGFALQGSLSNFAAGIMLIMFKPFKVGDFVEAGGKSGSVQEIQIFNTILTGPDNVKIIIPNSQVTGGSVVNYTVNGTRRVDLVVGISYGDDIKKAKEVISGVLASFDKVLDSPSPTVAVKELGDSSVNFVVRPWCEASDYWDVYFGTIEKVKTALDENGITIPFPQRDVHMINN